MFITHFFHRISSKTLWCDVSVSFNLKIRVFGKFLRIAAKPNWRVFISQIRDDGSGLVVLSSEITTPMHLGARISIINADITCHGYFWRRKKVERERHFAWPEEDIIEM